MSPDLTQPEQLQPSATTRLLLPHETTVFKPCYANLVPAGISQSYISQWLLQQGLEMSDSKRRAFYRWYLLERNNPGETRREAMFQTV